MAPITSIELAKIAGLTSSGLFTGYTWALSDATCPAILASPHATDTQVASQWRHQYLCGMIARLPPHSLPSPFLSSPPHTCPQLTHPHQISVPMCLTNALSFSYLAYSIPSNAPSPLLSRLYTTAALLTASGVPFAWTALRHVNGALAIRCQSVAPDRALDGRIALTYARSEERSRRNEKGKSTRELVDQWRRYNLVRTVVLTVGVLVGACAVAMDGR